MNALLPLPDDDAVETAALRALEDRTGGLDLAAIVVVIPAYDEQDAIAEVVRGVPPRLFGHAVDVLVVDDGSRDATARRAEAAGAVTCRAGVNRGQGAALRLGYRIARAGGARWLATIDADGQYDPADLERVLAPVVAGDADFVTGSRRLGREETTNRYRRLGVRFFAWLASRLAGQRITDTSNGLRAMRADLTGRLTLRQPQYQASELLMGALAVGARVVEVPTLMRDRTAGASKKGNDLLYGLRYARVLVSTWWRERSPNSQRS